MGESGQQRRDGTEDSLTRILGPADPAAQELAAGWGGPVASVADDAQRPAPDELYARLVVRALAQQARMTHETHDRPRASESAAGSRRTAPPASPAPKPTPTSNGRSSRVRRTTA